MAFITVSYSFATYIFRFAAAITLSSKTGMIQHVWHIDIFIGSGSKVVQEFWPLDRVHFASAAIERWAP